MALHYDFHDLDDSLKDDFDNSLLDERDKTDEDDIDEPVDDIDDIDDDATGKGRLFIPFTTSSDREKKIVPQISSFLLHILATKLLVNLVP